MNIYIVGNSGVGKSTWARIIGESYGYPIIEASHELRKNNPPLEWETPKMHSERLTEISKGLLSNDINHFYNQIRNRLDPDSNNIVVGIRNPFDLLKLMDPNRDLIIFLERNNSSLFAFEEFGLTSIASAIRFYEKVMGKTISLKFEVFDSVGAQETIEAVNLIDRINEHQHTIRNRM